MNYTAYGISLSGRSKNRAHCLNLCSLYCSDCVVGEHIWWWRLSISAFAVTFDTVVAGVLCARVGDGADSGVGGRSGGGW